MEDLQYVGDKEKKNLIEYEQKAKRLGSVGSKIIIRNAEDIEMANAWLVGAKRFFDEWEVERKKITVPINLGLDNINLLFKKVVSFVKPEYERVKQGVLDYREELRIKAEEDKRKADEAARATEKQVKDDLNTQAEELEKQGHTEAADNIRDAAKSIVAPVAQTQKFENTVGAGDGSIGGRGKIEVIVEDEFEFIKFVATKKDLAYVLKLDTVAIGRYAKNNKLFGRNIMPGITIRKKEGLIIKT